MQKGDVLCFSAVISYLVVLAGLKTVLEMALNLACNSHGIFCGVRRVLHVVQSWCVMKFCLLLCLSSLTLKLFRDCKNLISNVKACHGFTTLKL